MTGESSREGIEAGDEGMPVIDSEGNQIGTVADVGDEEVTIDPGPDVSDEARAALGWGAEPAATRPVPRSALERVPHDGIESYVAAFRLDLQSVNRGG